MIISVSIIINIKYVPVALGLMDKETYLKKMVSHYSSIEWMNTNLPHDAKILFLGTSGCYYLDREYILTEDRSFFHDINSTLELTEKIRKKDVTHIYIQGDPDDDGSMLRDIASGSLSIKDLNLKSVSDCDGLYTKNQISHNFDIISLAHLKKFVFLIGMELNGELEFLNLIKTKIVKSRLRGSFQEINDSLYAVKIKS